MYNRTHLATMCLTRKNGMNALDIVAKNVTGSTIAGNRKPQQEMCSQFCDFVGHLCVAACHSSAATTSAFSTRMIRALSTTRAFDILLITLFEALINLKIGITTTCEYVRAYRVQHAQDQSCDAMRAILLLISVSPEIITRNFIYMRTKTSDTRIMARLQANTAFLPSKFVSVLNRIHEYCTGFGNVTTNGNATTQCFLLQPLADTLHHATSEEQATAYQSVVPDFSGTHCDSSKS